MNKRTFNKNLVETYKCDLSKIVVNLFLQKLKENIINYLCIEMENTFF